MSAPRDGTAKPTQHRFAASEEPGYELTLFVSGASDLSARAITNARELCDVYLGAAYNLSIVDVHEDPAAVLRDRVLASPTLVKNRPLPARKFVGDLSETDRVLLALELPVTKHAPTTHA